MQPGGQDCDPGGDAAGSFPIFNSASHFAMARFLSNGTLDKTFGAGKTGLVDSDLGSPTASAVSMVSGSGQYLVLGGSVGSQFVLTAFTPDGILDPSFRNKRRCGDCHFQINRLSLDSWC